MTASVIALPSDGIITGWDFSTSGVKCLAFDLHGKVVARTSQTTDLWYGHPEEEGLRELSVTQLEGQARASVRAIADELRKIGRLQHWIAGGISATHHTSGRIDSRHNQVRRMICWNDQTLADYHKVGLKRLGGPAAVQKLIGGPWAIRYSLSHLVKDEECLPEAAWERTAKILSHGSLAAGFLTGNFNVTSVSSAASTGIFDFRHRRWSFDMLKAINSPKLRGWAKEQLPEVVDHFTPLGRLAPHVAQEAGILPAAAPWIFPTSDDQQAGLVGGGAVDAGQVAVVLGTSAVVNSSGSSPPTSGTLDVMCLNWGPYLWMRCYNNGAGLINHVFGSQPDFEALEKAATAMPVGADGFRVFPFLDPEPSLKIPKPYVKWAPSEPRHPGKRFRACLEALAYLIALGVREHEKAGQSISQITVSGGIARSDLMCRILASVLNRRLQRLESDEGPALGAAVTALAAAETTARRNRGKTHDFTVADAVATMVRFKAPVDPVAEWVDPYKAELKAFEAGLKRARAGGAKKKP